MRSRAFLQSLAIVVLSAGFTACGNDGPENQLGPPAKVTFAGTALSLNFGQFVAVPVVVQDANDNILRNVDVTFATSESTRVTVFKTTGASGDATASLCAGTWTPAAGPNTCVPATSAGTASITATAGGITSAPLVVTVHPRIARLEVSTSPFSCRSQTDSQEYTVLAFDDLGNDVTSNAGTITWTVSNTLIGTADASGLPTVQVRARRPGTTPLFANVAGVNSLPATFRVCTPVNIFIGTVNTNPAETAFSIAPAATKQMVATVLDEFNVSLADPGITYVSTDPSVAAVTSTGLVTGVNPGSAAVFAVCMPPGCNEGTNEGMGAQLVYSNVVSVTVTGTSSSRVYATAPNATTLVPIETSTNTAGTAINIPQITVNGTATTPVVNSMRFSRDGNLLFLGTDIGLLVLTVGSNTFAVANTTAKGRILAVSNSGRVITKDDTNVYVYDSATNTVVTNVAFAAATAASFSPDNSKAFVAAGTEVLSLGTPQVELTVAGATDVTFSPQGSIGYIAGGIANGLDVRATCNTQAQVDTVGLGAAPLLLATKFDSTRIFAIDTTSVHDVTADVDSSKCPPAPTHTAAAVTSFGVGTFAPKQLFTTTSGSHLFVTSDQASVLVYKPGDTTTPATTSVIPLLGGATAATTGGVTNDGALAYVGALGTNDVQRIDVATGTAVQQIAVNLKKADNTPLAPEFVAVRPR